MTGFFSLNLPTRKLRRSLQWSVFGTVSLKVLKKKEFLLKPRLKHSFTCKALCSAVTCGGSYFIIFLAFYLCFLVGGTNTLPLNDSDSEPHTDADLFPLDPVRQTAAYCFVFAW